MVPADVVLTQAVTDEETDRFLRLLVSMRRAGGSIRAMARCVGVSKSTMGRWMPAIDALASQTGQDEHASPDVPDDAASQMGRTP
jgi:hypothetical protein